MEIDKRPININITTAAIIKIILVLFLLYFFYLIKDIVAILFVALILSSALNPWVDWMQGKKIPRAIGVLLIYLILFIVIGGALYLVIPPIASEIKGLAVNFPHYLDKIISSLTWLKEYSAQHGILDNVKDSLGAVSSNLERAASGIFATVSGIFGGIFSFFLILVLTFYMVVEENAVKKLIWSVTPVIHQPYVMHLVNRIQKKIGYWLRGQLLLNFFIFILVYIGLSALNFFLGYLGSSARVEYTLVLALIAGLAETVPYLGGIFGAMPAVFFAFTQSPMLAMFVALLFYVIQLTENNILVPKVMQKVVGLNPIVSIAALLIGFKVGGVIGAVLSIPVATATNVVIKDLFEHKEAGEKAHGA